MKPFRCRVKHTSEALQLSNGYANYIEEWDEVSAFLGLPEDEKYGPTGRGEHATMRRPSKGRPGNVEVTLHYDEGSSESASRDDFLVKNRFGRVHRVSAQEFDANYEAI